MRSLDMEDGRSAIQKIHSALEGLAVEQALVQKGFKLNPLKFDPYNVDSYAWDVEFNGAKCEVKRFIKRQNDKFLSFNSESFRTFHKNKSHVTMLIGGVAKIWMDQVVQVKIAFITDPDTFFSHVYNTKFQESYGETNVYFNHKKVDINKIWTNQGVIT